MAARTKFRPRRGYVPVFAAIVELPQGVDNEKMFVPVGSKPVGRIIARLSVKETDRSIRRGVVELQGGIYHGTMIGPDTSSNRRVRAWKRSVNGAVNVSGGRDLTFTTELMPDGEKHVVARLKANMQQANALCEKWFGDIRFPGMPSC